MSSERTVVLVGLPGSGKTTFLAALWHQLESEEIQTAFTTDRLQPDREYLNGLRDAWLAFKEVPHTSAGIEQSALLHVRHVQTGKQFDLAIPDVAGETYRRQWLERQLPATYIHQLHHSFGVILFVHPEQVLHPALLDGATRDSTGSEVLHEWEPALTPTQVRLVDLIQSALCVFDRSHVLRLALVVSAWDLVESPPTPEVWVERHLPLLDQFLRANTGRVMSQVFGASAIGGSLTETEMLARTPTPSSRVRLHISSENLRDLSRTIEFLTLGES
jgi:hypothetical protein